MGDTPRVEDAASVSPSGSTSSGNRGITLRHSSSEIGDILYEGSVYLDGRPVCDNSWDSKEASVVCR